MSCDPPRGRFRPLPNVVCYDDFNHGTSGWLELMPNFTQPGFTARNSIVEKTKWGPVMLSTASFGLMGTHGAMSGLYSLKLATRPQANRYEEVPAPGSMSHAIKRLSVFQPKGRMQIEFWYTYTPEQDRIGLGEKGHSSVRHGLRCTRRKSPLFRGSAVFELGQR